MAQTAERTDLGAVFVLENEDRSVRRTFKKELEARLALEDFFMVERKHNWYLYREDFVPFTASSNARWDRKEIGRRINSNRFGGPLSAAFEK